VWHHPLVISVVVVEDHPLTRDGLVRRLGDWEDIEVIAAAGSVKELGEVVQAEPAPNVVVLDLGLPDACRRHVMGKVKTLVPEARILILTGQATPADLVLAVGEGALGYISKSEDAASVATAVRRVASGELHVTAALAGHLSRFGPDMKLGPQELEVLRLIATRGSTDDDIADQMVISKKTVRTYLDSIRQKAGGLVDPNHPRALVGFAIAVHAGCEWCREKG
jgi:DNA-binding NarL/FixJ family response regulator